MQNLVTIGEFSRLSHLTAKALRHYHEVGLLEPDRIDPSGYRRYSTAQVPQAQLVRRLRELDMPVADVKAVLSAPDEQARDRAIAEHLQRMEESLGRTAQLVASLRSLLRPEEEPIDVEYRTVPATTVFGIGATVGRGEIESWCGEAFPRLYEALAATRTDPAGPGAASYGEDFFTGGLGDVLAYVPIAVPAPDQSGAATTTLPAGRFAVAVHRGGYHDIDRTYGRLGSHVAGNDHALPLPIREHYLIGPNHTADDNDFRTEVWWPIRPTGTVATPSAEQPTSSPEV
jgi:DNA-binding transcriptional MerR regulator